MIEDIDEGDIVGLFSIVVGSGLHLEDVTAVTISLGLLHPCHTSHSSITFHCNVW